MASTWEGCETRWGGCIATTVREWMELGGAANQLPTSTLPGSGSDGRGGGGDGITTCCWGLGFIEACWSLPGIDKAGRRTGKDGLTHQTLQGNKGWRAWEEEEAEEEEEQ